jgi:hypothetical protein
MHRFNHPLAVITVTQVTLAIQPRSTPALALFKCPARAGSGRTLVGWPRAGRTERAGRCACPLLRVGPRAVTRCRLAAAHRRLHPPLEALQRQQGPARQGQPGAPRGAAAPPSPLVGTSAVRSRTGRSLVPGEMEAARSFAEAEKAVSTRHGRFCQGSRQRRRNG